jgi:hypothetical protein
MSQPTGEESSHHTADVAEGFAQPHPAQAAPAQEAPAEQVTPLMPDDADLRERWTRVQTAFVDDPRRAVEEADSLVADTMRRMSEVFSKERSTLEEQWRTGGQPSTEDVRLALQRYRQFFERLLSMPARQ